MDPPSWLATVGLTDTVHWVKVTQMISDKRAPCKDRTEERVRGSIYNLYKRTQYEFDGIWHLEPVPLSSHDVKNKCTASAWELQNCVHTRTLAPSDIRPHTAEGEGRILF